MNARLAALLALTLLAAPSADAQTPATEVRNAAGVSLLRLNTDAGLVVRGTSSVGAIPATGAGVRLMWFPARFAFRAGRVDAAQWDAASVGAGSVALGNNTTATGTYDTAMGESTTASGGVATAMGGYTTASGPYALATGLYTTASAFNATAMGYRAAALGDYATALGSDTRAAGVRSMALGTLTQATGESAVAIGNLGVASGINSLSLGYATVAAGNNSTAMGAFVSTDPGSAGAFAVGDASTATVMEAAVPHRFYARFANGYVLLTSANLSTGVVALAGATSWSSTSDSTRKTGFLRADGEAFLAGVSRLRLGSWSYRGRPAEERHYGPMAQDVFREFGRDGHGTVGNDTLLATADVDGVLFIAAHALEARTSALAARTAALEAEVATLRATLEAVLARLAGSAPVPAAASADGRR